MKLKSMKLDAAELKKRQEPATSIVSDQPVYPWGLSIGLEEESLDKLGIEALPEVGGELMVVAKVKVTSASSNEHIGGGKGKHKHRSVQLQICEMAIGEVSEEKDAAGELYTSKA